MLGEKIRKIRRDMGITQENLGEEVGLTPATISRIEGGSRGLSIGRLEAIAKALDVSMAELFLDETERVEFRPVKKPHQPNPFEVAPKWAQELLDEVRSLREQDKETGANRESVAGFAQVLRLQTWASQFQQRQTVQFREQEVEKILGRR